MWAFLRAKYRRPGSVGDEIRVQPKVTDIKPGVEPKDGPTPSFSNSHQLYYGDTERLLLRSGPCCAWSTDRHMTKRVLAPKGLQSTQTD